MPDQLPKDIRVAEEEHNIPYRAELQRKALHLVALVVPVSMGLLGKTASLVFLMPLAFAALTADILRSRSTAFASFINRIFGFMMRADELPPVGGPISINGATWVFVTASLLTFVFPVRIAAVAFGMFMVSDAAAALVGRRFGRTHWGTGPRTVEGSLAFITTGFVVMAAVPATAFWIGAVSVLCAGIAEIPPRPFNDNVRVPFVAATVIFLLERFIAGLPVTLFI